MVSDVDAPASWRTHTRARARSGEGGVNLLVILCLPFFLSAPFLVVFLVKVIGSLWMPLPGRRRGSIFLSCLCGKRKHRGRMGGEKEKK